MKQSARLRESLLGKALDPKWPMQRYVFAFTSAVAWATVGTKPSMTDGSHLSLLQCVGHVRPE